MAAGLKRARATARATQLRWWTNDNRRSWQLCAEGSIDAVGEVALALPVDGGAPSSEWEAFHHNAMRKGECGSRCLGTYPTCRAAKLAVRRAVRG